MKESPDDNARHRNLEGSKFSAEGFLGSDPRAVEEIIAEDARLLEDAGISLTQLADALREAYRRGREGLGVDVDLWEGRKAVYRESMGRIPSPYRGDGVFEKGEVELTDTASGITLHLTALGINLIEKHGFFQGYGSPYRIDPLRAVQVLRLSRSAK